MSGSAPLALPRRCRSYSSFFFTKDCLTHETASQRHLVQDEQEDDNKWTVNAGGPNSCSVITIFTVLGCPFCQRLKALLAERGWPFVDLSLSSYRHLSSDLLQLTDRLMAPQLFFNNFHVGDYAEVRTLADTGELDTLYHHFIKLQDFSYAPHTTRLTRKQAVQRDLRIARIRMRVNGNHRLINSVSSPASIGASSIGEEGGGATQHGDRMGAPSLDCRLLMPDFESKQAGKDRVRLRTQILHFEFPINGDLSPGLTAAAFLTQASDKSLTDQIALEHFTDVGTEAETLTSLVGAPISGVLRWFLRHLPIRDRTRWLRTQRKCFDGADLIQALKTHMWYAPEDATQICQALLDKDLLRSLSDSSAFNPLALYRLQLHEDPMMLNTAVVFSGKLSAKPVELLRLLHQALHDILALYTSCDGLVDYVGASRDRRFLEFVVATTELQRVELAHRTHDKVLSFIINAYNLAVKHAFVQVGVPRSSLSRRYFFNHVGYCIGGLRYTLNDMENGILRGNRRAPFNMNKPFGGRDLRASSSLSKVDCRIHFVLNCGASSCPPVKLFTEEALDEELRMAAMAFFEDDHNLSIDISTATICLSKVIEWYRRDFGNDELEICQRILEWCRGDKAAKLSELIERMRAATTPSSSLGSSWLGLPTSGGTANKDLIKVKYIPYNWDTHASSAIDFEPRNCFMLN